MKPIVVDEDTGRRLWTAAECSDAIGVARTSWRSAVSRGQAPQPVGELDARTPLWDAEEVAAYERDRPGVPGRPRKGS